MVMKVMGHTDVRTSMRYQHPVLDSIREAIDLRNSRHNPRHNELRSLGTPSLLKPLLFFSPSFSRKKNSSWWIGSQT